MYNSAALHGGAFRAARKVRGLGLYKSTTARVRGGALMAAGKMRGGALRAAGRLRAGSKLYNKAALRGGFDFYDSNMAQQWPPTEQGLYELGLLYFPEFYDGLNGHQQRAIEYALENGLADRTMNIALGVTFALNGLQLSKMESERKYWPGINKQIEDIRALIPTLPDADNVKKYYLKFNKFLRTNPYKDRKMVAADLSPEDVPFTTNPLFRYVPRRALVPSTRSGMASRMSANAPGRAYARFLQGYLEENPDKHLFRNGKINPNYHVVRHRTPRGSAASSAAASAAASRSSSGFLPEATSSPHPPPGF